MIASIMSSFISFDLNKEEELLAYSFNDCQIAGIQNLLSSAAEEIIKVVMETDELSLEGAKKLAYTKGQIDILKYLLAMADSIKEQRKEEADAAANNPSNNSQY